jgi:hypothetical protein
MFSYISNKKFMYLLLNSTLSPSLLAILTTTQTQGPFA